MKKGTAGFSGGVVGGLIKLFIDQIAFAINVSSVNTSGTISQMFYGGEYKLPLISWGIYILATGIVGLILSQIVSREYAANFISSGVVIGIVLWGIMNIIFAATGITTPTWSMGVGSLLVNLLSHIVLGLVIVYVVYRAKEEVNE